jgi:outer membrane protein TolC
MREKSAFGMTSDLFSKLFQPYFKKKMSSRVLHKIPILLAFLFLVTFHEVSGQVDTARFNAAGDNLIGLLPPLQLLIDSAIANSPEMTISEVELKQTEIQIKEGNKDWTELIAVNGRYTYGQFLANDDFGVVLSEPRGGYQVFAGVRLPLAYFMTRSERMDLLRAEMEIEQQEIRRTEMDIRDQVIATYNKLVLLQRLINISAEARESAILQYQMAEDRFREGQISLEELGSATNMRAGFASEYEKLRAEFSDVYASLERLVGTPFSKFPKE